MANCQKVTNCTPAELQAATNERPWGLNNPTWQLFAYGKVNDILPQGINSPYRSEEHTSELQSLRHLVCRLLLEKKKKATIRPAIHLDVSVGTNVPMSQTHPGTLARALSNVRPNAVDAYRGSASVQCY